MQPNIEIDREHVVIDGVRVPRSKSTSPSQWLDFWERGARGDAEIELKELEDKVAELEDAAEQLRIDLAEREQTIDALKERLEDVAALATKTI